MAISRETQILRDLASAHIGPCSGCDAPTWWRVAGTAVPICTRCTMATDKQAYNSVPIALREFLPPYPSDPTHAPGAGEQEDG